MTPPLILGIESSCDESACALVDADGRVWAQAVASQVDLHARFGGVVPEVAARRHIEAMLPLVDELFAEAGVDWNAVHAIGVTQGPGLIGCLLVGLETAKTLAWLHDKPLIGVNHLAGHLYALAVAPPRGEHLLIERGERVAVLPAARAGSAEDADAARIAQPQYPFVGLIVSGGHTSLVWADAPDRIRTLAQTRDDAVGEAYDKVARALGLGYPGGPVMDRLAAEGDPEACPLRAPMLRRDKPDFSFSGLKTAAGRLAEQLHARYPEGIPEAELKNVCAGFQAAAVESLLGKSLNALSEHGARDLVVSGGVACNRGLRRRAEDLCRRRPDLRVWFPHPSICTDNAMMIAGLAWQLDPLPHRAALALNADAGMGLG